MMKRNRGITLMSLVVAVIVLMILSGVGIQASYSTINGSKNKKLSVELGIVRQAVAEQYMKAVAVNRIKVLKTGESQVEFWVGERLEKIDENDLPPEEKVVQDSNYSKFINNLEPYDSANEKYIYQEDLYYKLTPEELTTIGVLDAKDSYIVNYKTKEVYNCSKKTNKSLQILYLQGEEN